MRIEIHFIIPQNRREFNIKFKLRLLRFSGKMQRVLGWRKGGTRFLERKLCKELYTAVAGLEVDMGL